MNIRNLALLIPFAAAACSADAPLAPAAATLRDDAPLAADAFSYNAPVTAEGYLAGADGVQLFYHVVGTGPDTAVVVSGGPGLSYTYLAADLAPLAHGRTLVFYDQRGTGRSTIVQDPTLLTVERQAEDIEALRRHFGMETLSLVGHSFGAVYAARYAASYPARVERLVMLNPASATAAYGAEFAGNRVSRTSPEALARQGELAGALLGGTSADPVADCAEFFESVFTVYFHDQANVARMRGGWCDMPAAGARNSLFALFAGMGSLGDAWNLLPLAASIQAPTLVVHASADPIPFASSRDYAGALPNGELLVIENAGHFPWAEQPVAFFTAVNNFLRRGDVLR